MNIPQPIVHSYYKNIVIFKSDYIDSYTQKMIRSQGTCSINSYKTKETLQSYSISFDTLRILLQLFTCRIGTLREFLKIS